VADLRRLPGPVADIWDWQLQGACRGSEADVFFHPEGERGAARSSRDAAAKAICRGCPVLADCAAHALSVREPYGVWGGMTEEDREARYGSDLGPLTAARARIAAERVPLPSRAAPIAG
jgi:WhiB family redox-sensing transcriptional regulator